MTCVTYGPFVGRSAALPGNQPRSTFLFWPLFTKTDSSFENWSKSDNWKIAKELTKKEIEAIDLGKFIKAIK